jgi:hypothetical protein
MKPSSLRLIIFSFLVLTLLTGPGVPVRGVRCSGGARIPGGGGCASGARAVKVPPSVVTRPVPPVVVKNVPTPKIPTVRGPVISRQIPNRPLPGNLPGVAGRAGRLSAIAPLVHPPAAELPGTAVESLAGLNVGESNLKALSGLRNLVHEPWPENLRIEDVNAAVEGFAKTASPQDVNAMRGYVSVRTRMEGRPDVAEKFLPAGEKPDAESVLRDLKVMEDLGAKPPSDLPWGDLPLPEAELFGLKAPVHEALDKDLPGLVPRLSAAEARARRVALRYIDVSAETHVYHYHLHLHNLMHLIRTSEKDKREDEVERRVDKLTEEERLMARRLLRTKSTDEIVTILRPGVGK